MTVVLSHRSALEYWRSTRIGTRSFQRIADIGSLFDGRLDEGERGALGPWWLTMPLHVIAPESAKRKKSKGEIGHLLSVDVPEGAVLDTRNGFCVCSPEFTFVLVASEFAIPKLIEVGCELCGTYDTWGGGCRECSPLTTVERLFAFAEAAEGVRGRKKALRALKYVVEGSASPRETVLTLLLCLPYNLGGYGIETPLLNHRIEFTKNARKLVGKRYCKCDLCWPDAMLAIEYEGEESHTGIEHVSKDSMRRDALIAMGFTVITITKWQINSSKDINGVAHVIAERLGKRLRYKDPDFTRKNLELRRLLLGRE